MAVRTKLKEGTRIQGRDLPEEIKQGLQIALEEEMRKEENQG